MSDEHDIGSVGDEAMKLFGALADMARQHSDIGEHIATDSAECRFCPVCRVVHAVRETSPEVKAHLMVAASSLLQAAAGMMENLPPASGSEGRPRGPEVEHIDLDESDEGDRP